MSSAKLWFDDGSGERLIPGEIMGLDVTWQDNLPNGGYYPTATTGQMRIRAVLSGDAQGRDTLAVASMTVPLSRDTQWSIAMIVRPRAAAGIPKDVDGRVVVPLRRIDPQVGGEDLVLSALKNSISQPYIR